MSWVRCPSAAPIIKNSRQRGACPQKHRRVGSGRLSIDSWTEQHPQILFSRIISANIAERARSRSRSGGVLSTANTASAGIRRHPPARAAHTCRAPKFLPGRLDNPCLLPNSHTPKPRRSHYQIPPRPKREQRPKHAPCKRRDSPRILANAMSSVTPSWRASVSNGA
jgi:hypothetical protein